MDVGTQQESEYSHKVDRLKKLSYYDILEKGCEQRIDRVWLKEIVNDNMELNQMRK